MLRWLSACLIVGSVAAAFVACGDSGSQTLCEPGTEVFCKCRGGFEGTKTCNEDGATFGECTTAEGSCPEISDTTSSNNTSTSNTSGSGGGSTGTLPLYAACTEGGDCQSGTCEGFCTRSCATYEDCTDDANMLYGDCIELEGGAKQVCAPYCVSPADCADYDATVMCGGAIALDDPSLAFGACAPWGADLAGMPDGTLCDDAEGTILVLGEYVVDGQCSLGNAGVHDVCVFGECTQACFENADCPAMDCDSNGSTPGCCTSMPSACGVN